MCDRWHKTPDEILAMPAWVQGMLKVAELGGYFDTQEGGTADEQRS